MRRKTGFRHPRPSRRRFWITGAIISIVLIVLAVFGIRLALSRQLKTDESINQAGIKSERFVDASGASLAFAASTYAETHSVPVVALTYVMLDEGLPAVHWIGGQTLSRYIRSGTPQVSFAVGTQHVITAFQVLPRECSFGLIVSSSQDPIISSDHLGGAGTYAHNEEGIVGCSAADAPSTWLPAHPFPLSSLPKARRFTQ